MADRIHFQNVPAPDAELLELIEDSSKRVLTDEELREQRISFAFGNAPYSRVVTKESVRLTSESIRLLS